MTMTQDRAAEIAGLFPASRKWDGEKWVPGDGEIAIAAALTAAREEGRKEGFEEAAKTAAVQIELLEEANEQGAKIYAALKVKSDAEIARLRAASAWRPIETAPRDGTDCLTFSPKRHPGFNQRIVVNYWDHGWQRSLQGNPPTHWQPLPEPPASESTP